MADNEDPTIESMADITQSTDPGVATAVVTWLAPTASDNSDVVTLTASHSSGSTFSLGDTVVTYTAVDPYGNMVTENLTVTIQGIRFI